MAATPLYVIQALAAVREGGEVNMMDRRGVAALCPSAKAEAWISKASSEEYIEALNDMGAATSDNPNFLEGIDEADSDEEDSDHNGNYSY